MKTVIKITIESGSSFQKKWVLNFLLESLSVIQSFYEEKYKNNKISVHTKEYL